MMYADLLTEAGKQLAQGLIEKLNADNINPADCLIQVCYNHRADENHYGWRINTINQPKVYSYFVTVPTKDFEEIVDKFPIRHMSQLVEHIVNSVLTESKFPFLK